MTDRKLGIEIGVGVTGREDLTQLDEDLQGLGSQAAQTGQQASSGATGLGRMGTAAAEASGDMRGMGTAAAAAADDLQATGRATQGVTQQTQLARESVHALRDGLIALVSAQAAGSLVMSAADMEKIQAGLKAVAGSAEQAAEQMEFIRRMSTAAGVDVAAAGDAFLGLAAATKGTAVEGEPAVRVFEAVTRAMAAAGKGSAETQNALLALSQIASKGTVSMEELRGQLGEALPGALQAAANGLGVTTQDLIQLVESGKVAAEDLFPALAKGLDDLYGAAPGAQTLSQELTNIGNAVTEMAADIGNNGGLAALKVGAEIAQSAITILGDTVIQTGQYIGTMVAAITTLDFSGLSAAFDDIEKSSRDRLLKAAEHNDVLRAALKASSTEAIQAALAAQDEAKARKDAGDAAETQANGMVKLALEYTKARKEAEDGLKLAQKEVEAAKARGEASVAQAKALGDESALRTAIAAAAAGEAEAMARVAERRQAELTLLEQERDARQAAAAGAGQLSEARRKEIDELNGLIAQKAIDVERSKAQAAASREKAAAQSEATLAITAEREAQEALNVTRTATARAELIGLQSQKELARQAEQLAILMGDEEKARKAKILQLEIEIQIVQARANVATVEAQGTIAVATAKRAELAASGQLTPVKQAEIDASIKLAEAKVAEAAASGRGAEVLSKSIELLKQGSDATTTLSGAQTGLTTSTDSSTAAIGRQSDGVATATTRLSAYEARLKSIAAYDLGASGGLGTLGDGAATAQRNSQVKSVLTPSGSTSTSSSSSSSSSTSRSGTGGSSGSVLDWSHQSQQSGIIGSGQLFPQFDSRSAFTVDGDAVVHTPSGSRWQYRSGSWILIDEGTLNANRAGSSSSSGTGVTTVVGDGTQAGEYSTRTPTASTSTAASASTSTSTAVSTPQAAISPNQVLTVRLVGAAGAQQSIDIRTGSAAEASAGVSRLLSVLSDAAARYQLG